ncbi:hypothetical protein DH2020_017529 [Rehmannia glutinosa]|uniref:DUF676 domain-containing protein n=1 Tax=Rehmannia glutinosa TaxID=99300 RepID=A0ABR0WUU1_REHGL
MTFSPTLFYSCSPRFLRHRNSNNPTSSSSNSCSPSPYSSYPDSANHRRGHNWNFITFSGIKSIWKLQSFTAKAMTTTQGNLSSPGAMINDEVKPDHLLVLVHGIMGSPSDWKYFEAELKKRLGKGFLIYASSCNMYTKTFTGIDGAGTRLADEVMQVVKKTESLKKISFLAHSLGGLIARYAVAVLYTPNVSSDRLDDIAASTPTNSLNPCSSNNGLIAGLEAINFITLATPHLGVRGNKQLPFLFGVPFLEKLAAPVAPIFTGRTGSQLFLTDGKPDKPPLLLRMASDCEEGNFISALGTFRCRFLYANVSYDHMVGWRTSSIRRETELVKPPSDSLDGYKHVVNVEYCPPVLSESPDFPPEAAKAKEAAQNEPSTKNTKQYHEIMEGIILTLLTQAVINSVKIDYLVKNEWFNNAGAGVVAHVADSIMQQEMKEDSTPYVSAGKL